MGGACDIIHTQIPCGGRCTMECVLPVCACSEGEIIGQLIYILVMSAGPDFGLLWGKR